MAVTPKNLPKAKVRVEDFVTKDGKFDSNKFWKLSDAQIADLVGNAVQDVRTYIVRPSTHNKAAASVRLLEALDKENPDLGLSYYVTLFKSIENTDGSALTKSYFDGLKQYDPDTFNLYLKYPGWEAYDMPDFDFNIYKKENMPKDAEPSTGALSNNPLNNASPAESAPGALTNPDTFEVGPKRLSYQSFDDAELNEILAKGSKEAEASNQPVLPNVGKTIEEVEANAYTGNEPPIAGYDTPITPPGVHVSFIDANGKPIDLTSEEITKFKPNSASPSPEAIGEAMRKAVKDRVGNTQLNPEDIPAFLAKEEGVVKTAEETAKTETAAETKTPETAKEGASTGKPDEPSKGVFGKTWDFLRNHPKLSLGLGIPTGLGIIGGIGITQADKIAEALKAGEDLDRNAGEESESPEVFDNVNYRVWENYTPDYLNEEYVPGKIPSHIPQDNLPSIKESTASKKVKSQPQVVNASTPVNNATADYVRAAYNSYIPSDAGRAYQKAIYGDPLELDRMRLQQQQQQKWRDFVMRSGQSPAELVQRGLMPYDALQYI